MQPRMLLGVKLLQAELALVGGDPQAALTILTNSLEEDDGQPTLLFPRGYRPGSGRLPVLCDPYGGPAAQRVVAARNWYLTSQWFADQGFAVLIAEELPLPEEPLVPELGMLLEPEPLPLPDVPDGVLPELLPLPVWAAANAGTRAMVATRRANTKFRM